MGDFGSKEASKERKKKARRSKTVSDSRACVESKGLASGLECVSATRAYDSFVVLSSDKFKSASPRSIATGSSVPQSFSGESMKWQVIDTRSLPSALQ